MISSCPPLENQRTSGRGNPIENPVAEPPKFPLGERLVLQEFGTTLLLDLGLAHARLEPLTAIVGTKTFIAVEIQTFPSRRVVTPIARNTPSHVGRLRGRGRSGDASHNLHGFHALP